MGSTLETIFLSAKNMTASSTTFRPGLASLRDAGTHYHSTVLGHAILLSELDERVRRIKWHLKFEPAGG
jgi:hypothetical protein